MGHCHGEQGCHTPERAHAGHSGWRARGALECPHFDHEEVAMNTKPSVISVLGFSLGLLTTGGTMAAEPPTSPTTFTPSELKWVPAPSIIPRGVQLAVLRGDPSKDGIFTIRLKIPPHYTFAPHWHPAQESFSVISGTFFIGMGDSVDKTNAKSLPAMSFAAVPAMHHHYAYTGGQGAEIDLTSYGPFQLYYVNPADDPTKSTGKR